MDVESAVDMGDSNGTRTWNVEKSEDVEDVDERWHKGSLEVKCPICRQMRQQLWEESEKRLQEKISRPAVR